MKILTLERKKHPDTFRSAKALAFYLKERGESFFVTSDPCDKDIFIRWGCSYPGNDNSTELNRRDLIQLSSNKNSLSEYLKEKIHLIEFFRGQPDKYPVVVRTIISGSGGKGIIVCKNEEEFKPYSENYWSYWYNFRFELGVHILGGKIIRVFKKVRDNGEDSEEEFPIRNLKNGYHFSLVNQEIYSKLPKFVDEVFKEFPIQMARLDVGWDIDNKIYRLIETNSAPCLINNENTLMLYGDFIFNKLKGE